MIVDKGLFLNRYGSDEFSWPTYVGETKNKTCFAIDFCLTHEDLNMCTSTTMITVPDKQKHECIVVYTVAMLPWHKFTFINLQT